MKCELIDCREPDEPGADWWTIERVEHDGREWMAPIPGSLGSMQFMRSARPSDSCIEGYAAEMIAIADAIQKGESASFKRCAAELVGDHYELYSPRNTQGDHAILTMEEAHELALDIRTKLSAA